MAYNEIKSDSYIEITDEEFKHIRDFIYETIGINLNDTKRALVTGRLQRILRQLGFSNFDEYYRYLKSNKSPAALSLLADTISTNHTYFGRESEHFDYLLKVVLPEIDQQLKQRKSNDLRVWCAGSSTGEEPYTLVMMMMEYFGTRYNELNAGLLATDISERALNIAKIGRYEESRLARLPKPIVSKYFRILKDGSYEVRDFLRSEVLYRRLNLIGQSFPFKKPFDVIFCRNVMIYFDETTRNALVDKFRRHMHVGGYLFIGHSETIDRKRGGFRYIMPAVYQKEY